ncbi:hypothetical protein Ancab_010019 [Ancistrocladus abbreviatus]
MEAHAIVALLHRRRRTTMPCSRKGVDVSNEEPNNSVDERDELHMLSSGKILKGALMEDMKASAERREKGTHPGNIAGTQTLTKFLQGGGSRSSGEDGGPNIIRAVMDRERSEPSGLQEKTAGPIKVQGSRTKNSKGRPNKVGLKR